MKIVEALKKCINNPWLMIVYLCENGLFNNLDDKRYLRLLYRAKMDKDLELGEPQTFNEKLQVLKLNVRKEEQTIMVDKLRVREYIKQKLGEEYLVPLIGVWNKAEEIDFDKLPKQFVMKCNHNSGLGMCICKNKEEINIKKVIKELNKGLKQDYYKTGREWPYKNIPRKIICEEYLKDESGDLKDYKVHCFNGEPKMILVCQNRFSDEGMTEDFYDINWKHLGVRRPKYENSKVKINKPEHLTEMLEISRILSRNYSFMRIDYYYVKNKIYFGEITFYPASGMERFIPDCYDSIFGQWLKIE